VAVTSDQLLVNVAVNTETAAVNLEKLVKGFDELNATLAKSNKAVEKTAHAVTDSGAEILKMAGIVELAKEAWHVLQEAIELVKEPIQESLKAFEEYQNEIEKLSRAVKLSGGDVEKSVEQFKQLADEMEANANVADEATLKMAAFGKSINLSDAMVTKMIKTAADLAAVTGDDVNSSFQQLTASLKGSAKSLAILDPALSNLTAEQFKAGKGIDQLSVKYAGFAAEAAKSYGGTLTKVHLLTGQIFKEIGEVFFTAFDLKGRSIIDKEMAEQVLAFVMKVKPMLMDMAQSVQDAIHTVRKAFKDVDWGSIATSVGILTASLIAFKVAALGLQLSSAISAIGGLTSAIQAMGGLSGIMGQISMFFKGSALLQGAKALALASAQYLAIALAIAAVGVSIDIVVRNFKHLEDLAVVIGLSFRILFQSVLRGFSGIVLVIMTGLESVLESVAGTFLDVGGVAEKALGGIRKEMVKTSDGMDKINKDLLADADAVKETGKGIDLGLLGEGMKFIKNMTGGVADKMKETKEGADKTGKSVKEIAEATKEWKKAVEELSKFMEDMRKNAAMAGATELQQIHAKADADRVALGLLVQKIALNGKLTDAVKEQIAASAELITLAERNATEQKRLDILKDITSQVQSLGMQYATLFVSERKRLEMETQMAQDAIDLKIKELSRDADTNKEAILALGAQKDIIQAIADEKRKAADIDMNDVKESFQKIKSPFDVDAMAAALGDTFDYAAKEFDAVTESFEKGLSGEFASMKDTFTSVEGFAQSFGALMATAIDALQGGPVGAIADVGDMIASLPDELMKVFSHLDTVVDKFMSAFPQAVQTVLAAIPKIVTKFVDALPKIIQSIVDALPKLADAMAAAIPKMIRALVNAMPKLIGAIIDAISKLIDALPEVFDAIFDGLPKIIETIFAKVPQIFISIFKAIPKIFASLMDNLPDIVLAFVQGIIQAMGDIVGGFVDEFIMGGGLEKMVGALLRAIPKIVIALVQGIARGLATIFKKMFGGGGGIKLPKIEIDTKQIASGIKALGRRLSGEASKLFAVTDLGSQGKAAADKAGALAEAIKNGMEAAGEKAKNVWAKILQALKDAWMWVYKTFIQPLVDNLMMVWKFVYDTVVKPLVEGLRAVWTFINESVIKPMLSLLQTTWTAMVSYLSSVWNGLMGVLKASFGAVVGVLSAAWNGIVAVFKSVWDGVQTIWSTMMDLFHGKISFLDAIGKIWGTMFDTAKVALNAVADTFKKYFDGLKDIFDAAVKGFKDTFDSLKDGAAKIGTSIWDALKKGFDGATKMFTSIGTSIWDSLKDGLSGIGTIFKDALDKINPANILAKAFKIDMGGKGTVENALGIDIPFTSFAGGGMVPGQAMVPGNSLLNDRVVALLSPGEAVIPRELMGNPAIKNLIDLILSGSLKPPRYAYGVNDLKKDAKKKGGQLSDAAKASGLEDALAGLDPQAMWKKAKEEAMKVVMRSFAANKFHGGGLVPRYGFGGEVPAMLQPGEFVMNRGAVSSLGAQAMHSMNSGRTAAPGATNIDLRIDIKTTEPIDDSFFRNRLMPKIKDELKRASLDGAFIVSAAGVRT